jgi:hypothetical protein
MALWLYGSMGSMGSMALWDLWFYGLYRIYGSMASDAYSQCIYLHCNAAIQIPTNDGYLIIFLIAPADFGPDEVPDKSVTSRYRDNLTRLSGCP